MAQFQGFFLFGLGGDGLVEDVFFFLVREVFRGGVFRGIRDMVVLPGVRILWGLMERNDGNLQ